MTLVLVHDFLTLWHLTKGTFNIHWNDQEESISNQNYLQRFLFSWIAMALRGQYLLISFQLGLGTTTIAKLVFSIL